MGDPKLLGKIAVLTGGGRGLGKSLVEALAAEGAHVALSYCGSRAGAEEAAAGVRALGRRSFVGAADARERGAMAGFVEAAVVALGGIDILVNNVGVFHKTPVGSITEEALDEAFDVNVKAAVLASQAAAGRMGRGGVIVNVASLGGIRPWGSYLPYCASKAALIMATRCLARALAPEIRVNAVAPGILEPPGAGDAVRERVPLRRFGRHAEVVNAVLFLAADAAYTTGEVLSVDGGRGLA